MEVRLLVVDDEVQIRTGIEKGIPWGEYGISEVLSAASGVEALDIIQKNNINILITDIRMPVMDGLELARQAKNIRPNIHIIILSGFSEFDYAKTAIGIGVKDYLLKPVKLKELTKIVAQLVADLEYERQVSLKKEKSEMKLQILQYIQSGNGCPQKFVTILENFFGTDKCHMSLCVVFDPDSKNIHTRVNMCSKIKDSLKRIEFSGKHYWLELPERIIYVVLMDIRYSRFEVIQKVSCILKELNSISLKENDTTISGVISGNYPLIHLSEAYTECNRLLNNRLYLGLGMLCYQEMENEQSPISFYFESEEQLRKNILSFQYEEAKKIIIEHFIKMKQLKINSYDLVKENCLTFKQILFRYIKETGLEAEKVIEKNEDALLQVPDLLSLEDYQTWVCDLYYLILKGVSEHTEKNVSNTVMSAIAYVSTHYQDDITIEFIAGYVKKSKNYFSYLFKKEMKVTFTEYLNRYRIEQACRLLESSLSLAGEIGHQVGFKDEKYFSAVFKKIMGCSPSAYRKKEI